MQVVLDIIECARVVFIPHILFDVCDHVTYTGTSKLRVDISLIIANLIFRWWYLHRLSSRYLSTFFHSSLSSSVENRNRRLPASSARNLLIVAEEDFDWQPSIAADLKAVGTAAELLHLVVGELPAVELEVGLNPGCGDGLGDDGGAALETPHEAALRALVWVSRQTEFT